MDDISLTVELKCLFCDCILEGESGKEFASGDMIKCQHCNELNDYDSLIDVAKEEGFSLVKERVDKEVKAVFGRIFKK